MSRQQIVADSDSKRRVPPEPLGRRRRRRQGGQDQAFGLTSARFRPTFVLLAITVIGSVMAVGTVHATTLLFVAPVALSAGGLAFAQLTEARVPKPALLLLGLAAYSALQALPLPLGLLRHLDRATASIWEGTFDALVQPLSFASISLDPGASLLEALKWWCYAGVFVASAHVAAKRGSRWIFGLVFTAAVSTAVVTLVHRLAGAEALFGVYRPIFKGPRFATTPLLNPNNLAGYLNLGVFAGISLMLVRRQVLPRWLLALGIATVMGLSAVTGSRAGFLTLVVGSIASLALLRWRTFEGRSVPRQVRLGLGLALAAGAALFYVGASSDVLQALREEGVKKLDLIRWTRPLIADHPWTGVGRGAFETAFPAYRADIGHHLYQFAENFLTQWASEWGVPVALVSLCGFAWWCRPARLGAARSPAALIGVVGLAVLLAQNLLDLGLEVTSISIAFFALLGGLWGGETEARADLVDEVKVGGQARWVAVAFLTVGAALWLGVALVGRHTAIVDRLHLVDQYRQASGAEPGRRAQLLDALAPDVAAAVRRHPADPFLTLLAGLVARGRDENPLAWFARSIERDPMAGRPYLALAESLATRGAGAQALGAIRRAVERDHALMGRGIALALQLSRSDEELLLAVPEGRAGAPMLTSLARLPKLRERRPELLSAAMRRDPSYAKPRYQRVWDLLSELDKQDGSCSAHRRSPCVDEVAQHAARLRVLEPDSELAIVVQARLLYAQSKPAAAIRLLTDSCPVFAQRLDCLRWRVLLTERSGDVVGLDEASSSYLSAACSSSSACATAASWLGGIFTSGGHWAKALQMFERAAREQGTPQAWQQVAVAAERLGLAGVARRAREHAARASGAPPRGAVTKELEKELRHDLVDPAGSP